MKENLRKCCKCGCSPADDPNITLHRFPKPGRTNILKTELWAKYCFPHDSWSSPEFQNKLYSKHLMLCTKHFKRSSFIDNSGKRLVKSAVPDVDSDKDPIISSGFPLYGTTLEVVEDADLSVTEKDNNGDDFFTPVELNVVEDVDLSVTEEDNDGDDSDTPVESNLNEDNHSVLGSLCWECAARLKAAATFRSKALLSDSLLQDLITSGEQIRKNDITALKENVLSECLISAQTLTVTDVFHIVDIEEQNSNDIEKSIIQEIEENNSEMYIEEDDNVAFNTEIEDDPSSPNNEERNTKGENQLDNSSSSQAKINSAISSLWLNTGQCSLLRSALNPQEDFDDENIDKNVISKSDPISRTGCQRTKEPTYPAKRKKYGTSNDRWFTGKTY